MYHAIGDHHYVEALIKAGAEIDEGSVKRAGQMGTERCVKLLMEAGGDIGVILTAALTYRRYQENLVDLLINAGAQITQETLTEIFPWAVERNKVQYVKWLINVGADVNNSQGTEALILAAGMGSVECLSLLIKAGAYVNARHENFFIQNSIVCCCQQRFA